MATNNEWRSSGGSRRLAEDHQGDLGLAILTRLGELLLNGWASHRLVFYLNHNAQNACGGVAAVDRDDRVTLL